MCVDDAAVFVRHATTATHMPDSMRAHFQIEDGVLPIEAWSAGVDFLREVGALANLVDNIGAALTRRPDGLVVSERHPSKQAARKQGLNPSHVPSVEYVIGSELTVGQARGNHDAADAHATARTMKVRTIVSPHWTHQVCGEQGSQRRLQWIATHWRGPKDAPVSVHAVQLGGVAKK